jgi:hypothetical protein
MVNIKSLVFIELTVPSKSIWRVWRAKRWWLMPVIPATQEAEIRRVEV